MPAGVLAEVMVKVFVLTLFGLLLKKLGLIDEGLQKGLSRLLMDAVLPVSILVSGNTPFSKELSGGMLQSGIVATCYYAMALVLVGLGSWRLPLAANKKGVFANLAVFANTAFLGFPVVQAMFGSEGMLYAIVYNLLFQLCLFTVGIRLLDSTGKLSVRSVLLDVRTIAAVLSIVLFLSPVRIPTIVAGPLDTIGSMTVPLSLIIIGCSLGDIKLRTIFTDRWSYVVSALRLLVFPLTMLGVFVLLGISGSAAATCVVLTGLPPATMNVILTEQYGGDVGFATSTTIQGMLLMLASLPLLLGLISNVLL